jgi:hypothetical protein
MTISKSIKDRVAEDIAKAEKDRRKERLEKDYKRWIAGAAQPQISPGDRAHFKKLAEATLAELEKLKKKA